MVVRNCSSCLDKDQNETFSSIQIISRHQQLETEISWNINIGNSSLISVLFVVVEVFYDFLKYDSTEVFEMAYTTLGFTEVICGFVNIQRVSPQL